MTISFNTIPTNLRKPLFYIELDGSAAGAYSESQRMLVVAQKLEGGSFPALTPERISSPDQARAYFGAGSVLHLMLTTAFANNDFSEIVAIALDDPSGAKATATITITGTATADGTLYPYVSGVQVPVGVQTGDDPTAIAAKIVTAVTAKTDLPCTAANVAGVVTLTAKHTGAIGNDNTLHYNWGGYWADELPVAGVTVTLSGASFGGGTGTVDISTVTAAMADEPFEYIVQPYTDSTALTAWQTHLATRWAYNKRLYGQVFSAKSGTSSALATFGVTRNDPHTSIMGMYGSPTPAYVLAAAYGATAAKYLEIDPARPLQSLQLIGVIAPKTSARFTDSEVNTLLNSGIATSFVTSGAVRIQREITTYQKNSFGVSDAAFLDVTTLATAARFQREMESRITTKYPRHKLADDGTQFGAGQAIVTPSIIKSELIAAYSLLERKGLVEDAAGFAKSMVVERDETDRNRLNVLVQPNFVNQMRVFAALNKFIL